MNIKFSQFIFFSMMLISITFCNSTNKYQTKKDILNLLNCCSDTTSKFDKKIILNSFSETLKSLLPKYKGVDKKGFYVSEECRLSGAFIFDLADTLNFQVGFQGCVKFQDGHVYHFASIVHQLSYSNIAILNKGKVKIFKALNCPAKGDQLKDVINYITDSIFEVKNKEELIKHVISYRKYGFYRMEDPQDEFICK